jgi:hypothetical protein
MQRLLLASSILAALICAQQPATAADVAVIPSGPPVYVEPAPVVVPAPVAVAPATTGCWRYGKLGWGWYPCWAGPPAYWHTYKGWRPHWARQHWLFYR